MDDEQTTDWWTLATGDLDGIADVQDYWLASEGEVHVTLKDGSRFTIRVEKTS